MTVSLFEAPSVWHRAIYPVISSPTCLAPRQLENEFELCRPATSATLYHAPRFFHVGYTYSEAAVLVL